MATINLKNKINSKRGLDMAKIAIVGGGVSGLSAGIYAQLSGHSAVICERHNVAGGNLTGWQRGEYHIDNCIHWLTGTNPTTDGYRMWETLGALGDVDVYQPPTLYTCEENGNLISLNCDLEQTKNDMLKISPEDKKEILSLVKAVETLQGIVGIAGKDHNEKYSKTKIATSAPTLLKYYNLSAKDLSQKFKNPLLQQFISSFLGNEFTSLALIVIWAHFCGENGGLPKGGSLAMANRMTDRFKSLGGELLLKTEVIGIEHENSKATALNLSNGEKITADYVVLTADPAVIFSKLTDIPMPSQLKKLYNDPKLHRFSSYQCAFSCDTVELGFSGDLMIEIPPKYRSLLRTEAFALREFSHEKSFAPEGKQILQTLCFCDEKMSREFIKMRNNKELYDSEKQELAATLKSLIEKKLPHLTGKLTCIDVWTPATYQRYVDSEIGSFMSFALPKGRLPIRQSNRIKGLDNVILATQWQQMPGGLPIAADGGKKAIETINELEFQRYQAKERAKQTDHKNIHAKTAPQSSP